MGRRWCLAGGSWSDWGYRGGESRVSDGPPRRWSSCVGGQSPGGSRGAGAGTAAEQRRTSLGVVRVRLGQFRAAGGGIRVRQRGETRPAPESSSVACPPPTPSSTGLPLRPPAALPPARHHGKRKLLQAVPQPVSGLAGLGSIGAFGSGDGGEGAGLNDEGPRSAGALVSRRGILSGLGTTAGAEGRELAGEGWRFGRTEWAPQLPGAGLGG